MNSRRGRFRARTAFIRDNEFGLGVNNRATVLRTKSKCCITPSRLRNYMYLRPNILVSMFAPRHTSFLGGPGNAPSRDLEGALMKNDEGGGNDCRCRSGLR